MIGLDEFLPASYRHYRPTFRNTNLSFISLYKFFMRFLQVPRRIFCFVWFVRMFARLEIEMLLWNLFEINDNISLFWFRLDCLIHNEISISLNSRRAIQVSSYSSQLLHKCTAIMAAIYIFILILSTVYKFVCAPIELTIPSGYNACVHSTDDTVYGIQRITQINDRN